MIIEKVLLSINVRWWNAEAAYAINVARGLVDKGVQVWMIVNKDSPVHIKAQKYDIRVITDIELDSKSPLVHWKNLRKILRLVEINNIQVINSYKSNGSFLFSLVRKIHPEITYVKTRGEARCPNNNFANRYLYGPKGCDGIVVVGEQVRRWIYGLFVEKEKQRISVIHYGDSAVVAENKVDRKKITQELGVSKSSKLFALLGRTQKVKGHVLLLKSLMKLKNLHIHLLFLVKDLDEFPEELKEIKRFIQLNNLDDKVTILGFQENLGKILSCIDCGVIPSLSSEVNCRVAVEFFSMGIPIVAFPTGTLPDIICHKENGFLCQEKTETSLASGMRWILDEATRIDEVGCQALQDYKNKYTLEEFSSSTLEFYEEIRKHS
jgi:glycosyltransferase involved in cell wall biosynthesis